MAASVLFDFCEARKKFNQVIHAVVDADSLEPYKTFVQGYNGSESEKRVTIDQALRDVFRELSSEGRGCDVYRKFITLSIEAASNELCSTSVPFMLLTDIFDVIPLDQCEELFGLVEDKVSVWKSTTFYDTGKNYLLRMCNDLLRRLSKSQNTVFCGRIQLFLSRLFPLAEKSALNLMSQFNIENITLYTQTKQEATDGEVPKKEETKDESMEVEDGEMNEKKPTVPIDYNLYRKFWSLQDFFRKPTQFYEKKSWGTFTANADSVLDAFASSKLDDHKSSKKKLSLRRNLDADAFFAKYLTSEKLLDLQLNDSNFRRYVLVQFLIMFQYLNAQVKFKTVSQTLSEDQNSWVKTATDRIYTLIRETPPNGDQFATTVEHTLGREEHWNTWKNNGCPDFEKKQAAEQAKPTRSRAKRRRMGDDLQASGGKVIKMGAPELTKLWNLNPSNMAACKSDDRMFLPTLEDFFEDAIEQNDPEAQVEEEYKLTNDQTFQWKALRLLARRSPQFFTNSTTPALELKVYLKGMLSKLAKEIPRESGEEMKTFDEEPEEDEGIKESQMDEDLKQADGTGERDTEPADLILKKDELKKVAEMIGKGWRRLAVELSFPDDDVEYLASEGESETERALKMLIVWLDNEGDKATTAVLRLALKEVGFTDVAESVFGLS